MVATQIPICCCVIGAILIAVGCIFTFKFVDCDHTSECTYDHNGDLIYKGQKVKDCYGQPGKTIHCHWEDGKECPVLDNCSTVGWLIAACILFGLVVILIGIVVLFCFCSKG